MIDVTKADILKRYAHARAQRDTSMRAQVIRALRLAWYNDDITTEEYRACMQVLEDRRVEEQP